MLPFEFQRGFTHVPRVYVIIPRKREQRICDGLIQLLLAAALKVRPPDAQAEKRIAGKQDVLLLKQVTDGAL